MYFNCDADGITTQQLMVCTAISTLFHEQNMQCVVNSIDPLMFEVKPQMSTQMRERLIVNRVGAVLKGYEGKMEGHNLVVSKQAQESAGTRRKRAS